MKIYLKFILFLLIAQACVQPYNVDIYTSKGYLLVDGTITNLDDPQYISIGRTAPDAQFNSSQYTNEIPPPENTLTPQTNAIVEVIVNGSQRIRLSEIEPGVYKMPTGFIGKIGSTYQLKISTTDGKRYESLVEKILPVPPIKKITEVFNKKGMLKPRSTTEYIATNDFSIDYDDPADEKNLYRWRYVDYEVLKYCETCVRGRYYKYETETGLTGECFRDLTLDNDDRFDYVCDGRCWGLFPSTDINIGSDIYTNGQPQFDKLVGQVPLYQRNPCMVSIQQMSLSANAYRYFKLLRDQSLNTGTLSDTPPAPIQSNLVNIDDKNELILGFFSASAVSEVRVMLDRRNTTGASYNTLFETFNNRIPLSESFNFDRPKPETAICKENRTKTPILPRGWLY